MNGLTILGLSKLQERTQGSPAVRIAILDGIVDTNHPCFNGADLIRLPTLARGKASTGAMSTHGTHITSLIFGQPSTAVSGIAAHCHGLLAPVFANDNRSLSQLELARTIEQAVEAGAHIISISGGALTDVGEAEDLLERAVRTCIERNVLVVAAAGNNGCDCLHVPAALPTVLAVGAMDAHGYPLEFSNWGEAYQNQGILAPGKDIPGAKPGGGTVQLSGTSFATPIVAGVAALLLSLQMQQGDEPNPHGVREAILSTALPCNLEDTDSDRKCLAGMLNIPGAIEKLTGETMSDDLSPATPVGVVGLDPKATNIASIASTEGESATNSALIEAAGCDCGDTPELVDEHDSFKGADGTEGAALATQSQKHQPPPMPMAEPPATIYSSSVNPPTPVMSDIHLETHNAAVLPSNAQESHGLIYAIGTLGYDFGTQARQDSFSQFMYPQQDDAGTYMPVDPNSPRQMVQHLEERPWEAQSLIWTLNLEATPIYALEPLGAFANHVHGRFSDLLGAQGKQKTDSAYVERVVIPGYLTGRTVKLFSGQVVPVVKLDSPRGIEGWTVAAWAQGVVAQAQRNMNEQANADSQPVDPAKVHRSLVNFLNRIYYDFRNLGQTAHDRALNRAATFAFGAVADVFSDSKLRGMELDTIDVTKSPVCRIDSDCWDVQLKFFDPENERRAKEIRKITFDVSDIIPVFIGEIQAWAARG